MFWRFRLPDPVLHPLQRIILWVSFFFYLLAPFSTSFSFICLSSFFLILTLGVEKSLFFLVFFLVLCCVQYFDPTNKVKSNHRALGSASRNNKVPRLLTPAGAYRLVWPRTTVQKRWVFLGIGKHSCCLNMHFAYPADMLLSKSQSLTCTAPRKGWMCHWTEFRLKRPSAVLHRA